MKNTRSRCFTIVLYPENSKDMNTLNYIKQHFNYAYILHDKDIDEKKKTLKKAHYHVIIKFENARSLENVKKILNVNYLEPANFYACARYLLHLDFPNKYQYEKSDVFSNISNISACFDTEVESSNYAFKILYTFIVDHDPTFTDLCEYALSHGLISEVKKNPYLFKCLTKG